MDHGTLPNDPIADGRQRVVDRRLVDRIAAAVLVVGVTVANLFTEIVSIEVVSVACVPAGGQGVCARCIVEARRIGAVVGAGDRHLAGHRRDLRAGVLENRCSTVIVLVPTVSVLTFVVPTKVPLPGEVRFALSVPAPDSNTVATW